jgi:putative membrane protein
MKKILITIVPVILQSSSVFADRPGYGEGYGMGPWMMWGYGMGWFGPIIMIIFWIAVIVGIILLIRWVIVSSRKEYKVKSDESALEILKKRYAKSEISKEEFEEKKKDIL